jgi:serine/threonine-protein kinase RsbW
MEDQSNQIVEERRKRFLAEYKSLDSLSEFIEKAAETCGLSPDTIYHVQVSVDEAFSNIVEHAYEGEQEEDVECLCQITTRALVVILRDHGRPFNPDQVPGPPLDGSLKERKKGGLGLFFMRKWMDEIHFEIRPCEDSIHPCNVLTMVKYKENG